VEGENEWINGKVDLDKKGEVWYNGIKGELLYD